MTDVKQFQVNRSKSFPQDEILSDHLLNWLSSM